MLNRCACWLAGLAASAALLIGCRSVAGSLLALVPPACALAWMLGAAELAGGSGLGGTVLLPGLLGLTVAGGQDDGAPTTALATMSGLVGLIAARHPGLRAAGLLAVLGLGAGLLAAVTLVPALRQVLRDRRMRRPPATG